jgi:hypothetical protein
MDQEIGEASAKLAIIYAALTLGVMGMAAAAWIAGPMTELDADVADLLRDLVVLLTVVTAIQVVVLFRVQGARMQALPDLPARLAAYRGRTIAMAASAEGVALFAGVIALLTGASWHAIPAYVLFAAVIAWTWPTPKRLIATVAPQSVPDKYS